MDMRITSLLCLALLLSPQLWANETKAQAADESSSTPNTVWEGDLLPKDLDKFVKGKYNQVDGSVFINNTDLADLSALSELTSVTGSLYIGQRPSSSRQIINELLSFSPLMGGGPAPLEPLTTPLGGNDNLISLTGLEKLEHIGSALNIEDNPKLESIKALSALKSVRYLDMTHNAQLKDLHGLETLVKESTQPYSLRMINNPKITTLSPLLGIKSLTSLVISESNLKSLKGLDQLTHVSGSINLGENPKLTTLKGLDQLQHINDNVFLTENNSLTHIKNLNSLKTLTGLLSITKNRRLKDLSGLEKIKNVKALTIEKNTSLNSLAGLDGLNEIQEDVEIFENPLLDDTSALNQLIKIGGRLVTFDNGYNALSGFEKLESVKVMVIKEAVDQSAFNQLSKTDKVSVYIEDGALVESLDGLLPNLTQVKTLSISGNKKLQRLGDFIPNLKRVEKLYISSNQSISNLDGLIGLEFAKEINIKNNEGINKITGLNTLRKVVRMDIKNNINLQEVTGFNGLDSLNKLYIEDNIDLEKLHGFSQLDQVKELWIKENKSLQSVSALNALNTIKGTLWVDENPKLNELGELPVQGSVKDIYIDQNPSLQDLTALKNLTSAESIRIDGNHLINLEGLNKLNRVGYLRIEENPKLETLEGLNSLTEVRTLDIDNNNALLNLSGLESLNSLQKLIIRNNNELNDYDGLSAVALVHLKPSNFNVFRNKLNMEQTSLILSAALTRQKIDAEFLNKHTNLKQLYFLRNEAFARQGFVFGKDDLIEYFSRFGWYSPDDNAEIKLNDVTEENIKIIKDIESKAHVRLKKAIDTLKNQQSMFITKDDAFFAPSISRFAQILSVKKLIQKDLTHKEDYFIQEDGCLDNLNISFSEKGQSFNFSVNHCVHAEYNEETDELEAPMFNNAYKLCNMRLADAQREEVLYITTQCEVDTTETMDEGTEFITKTVSYDFELIGDAFKLKQRDSYDEMGY